MRTSMAWAELGQQLPGTPLHGRTTGGSCKHVAQPQLGDGHLLARSDCKFCHWRVVKPRFHSLKHLIGALATGADDKDVRKLFLVSCVPRLKVLYTQLVWLCSTRCQAHLEDVVGGAGSCSCLLSLAEVGKGAILGAQAVEVADAGVGSKRLEPTSHWGLYTGGMSKMSMWSMVVAPACTTHRVHAKSMRPGC